MKTSTPNWPDPNNNKTAAPGWNPGTADEAELPTDKESKPVNDRTARHAMTLGVRDIITRHPHSNASGWWEVTAPPVQYGDCAEIDVRADDGSPARFVVALGKHVTIHASARADVIAGLRELAEFLETHPWVPVNPSPIVAYSASTGRSTRDAVAEVDRVAEILEVVPGPQFDGGPHHVAVRDFGAVRYEAAAIHAYREQVPE